MIELMADIESNNLKAAMTIAALFEKATVLRTASAVVEKALQRMPVGIAPLDGKCVKESLGEESESAK